MIRREFFGKILLALFAPEAFVAIREIEKRERESAPSDVNEVARQMMASIKRDCA